MKTILETALTILVLISLYALGYHSRVEEIVIRECPEVRVYIDGALVKKGTSE